MNRLAVICVFLASFILYGCVDEVDEVLMQKETVSLVVRGMVIFDYKGSTCQMAYNAQRCEFRVMDDDMAHYFALKCNADLSDEGQEVTADLRYTTASDVKVERDLTFKVEKKEPSTGMFWLWCRSRKIGVVIRKF